MSISQLPSTKSNSPDSIETLPDFESTDFLRNHIESILKFYDGRCVDEYGGGFFQNFKVGKYLTC